MNCEHCRHFREVSPEVGECLLVAVELVIGERQPILVASFSQYDCWEGNAPAHGEKKEVTRAEAEPRRSFGT